MKFSLIVIVNNKKDKVDKCIKSIINQTYINYEILIINNLLDNNKQEFKILNEYPNITVYETKEASISYCRNFGIKNAKGKYIIFVNANDSLNNKNVLKNINDYLNDNELDVLKCKINYTGKYYDDRFSEIEFEGLDGASALIKFCKENKIFATNFSYVFRREFLIGNKLYFIDNTFHEDYGLIPMIIYKAKKMSSIKLLMYNYSNIKEDTNSVERINDFLLHTYNNIDYFYKNIKNETVTNYFYKRLNIKMNKLSNTELSEINTLLLEECNNIANHKTDCFSKKIDEIFKEYNFNNFAIEYKISLKILCSAAKRIFKNNLLSITIGGSAGKNFIIPDWSDLDVYIILKEYDFKNIELFDKLMSKFNIHIGLTYYSINEIESMYVDAKTKIMVYEKNNYNVNPTLYGKDYFKNVDYKDIRISDINNLPIILHEVRRMHITALNNKNNINNKYLKKLVLLIKCFLSTRYVFTYGYKNVIDEFLKIVNNKRPMSNRIYFDIEDIINNYNIKKEDVLEFGKITISFIENNLKER